MQTPRKSNLIPQISPPISTIRNPNPNQSQTQIPTPNPCESFLFNLSPQNKATQNSRSSKPYPKPKPNTNLSNKRNPKTKTIIPCPIHPKSPSNLAQFQTYPQSNTSPFINHIHSKSRLPLNPNFFPNSKSPKIPDTRNPNQTQPEPQSQIFIPLPFPNLPKTHWSKKPVKKKWRKKKRKQQAIVGRRVNKEATDIPAIPDLVIPLSPEVPLLRQ